MLGLLHRPWLPGPAPIALNRDRTAVVRIDRRGGRVHADRPVVQAVRQDHQVGGEPVAAHVRGLPHLPGMPGRQRLRQRRAEPRAAGAPLPVRADQEHRIIAGNPERRDDPGRQFLQVAFGQFRGRGGYLGAPQEGLATRGPAKEDGAHVAHLPAPRPADHLHPRAEFRRRLHQCRQRRGLGGLGRLVWPRARVLDQQPGPGRLRCRGRRGFGAVVAFRAVLANSGHPGQPPITVAAIHARQRNAGGGSPARGPLTGTRRASTSCGARSSPRGRHGLSRSAGPRRDVAPDVPALPLTAVTGDTCPLLADMAWMSQPCRSCDVDATSTP